VQNNIRIQVGIPKKEMPLGEEFVVDFKEASKSFTLNKDIWAKAVTDSIQAGRDKSPAIIVILGEGNTKVRLAIIEMSMLEQLTEKEYNV
jgi:hypothetical protein